MVCAIPHLRARAWRRESCVLTMTACIERADWPQEKLLVSNWRFSRVIHGFKQEDLR